jgi:hypothetical protein
MSIHENAEEVDIIEAITGRKHKMITFYGETVGRFVMNVAKISGLHGYNEATNQFVNTSDFKKFKVVIGGENINHSKYNKKKMSFFLIQNQPFFASAIVQLVIDSRIKNRITRQLYLVGSPLLGNFTFRDGTKFDYRNKSHQIRIVKEKCLIKLPFLSEQRGKGKGSSGRTRTKGSGRRGGDNWFDKTPTLGTRSYQNNVSVTDDFENMQNLTTLSNQQSGFNFGKQNKGEFFNYNGNQTKNDLFNYSPSTNNQQQQRREKIRFVDVENSRTENFELSNDSSVPKYRMCEYGINFIGECLNEDCKAFNQMVVCPMGYGDFDLMMRRMKCPECKHEFDAVNCGFVRSWWKLCGEKSDDKIVNKEWILAGKDGQMSMFVPNEFKKKEEIATNIKKFAVDWKVLKFQVRDPNKCPTDMKNEKLDPDKSFCSICIDSIEKFGNLEVTKCLHFFHKECVQEWILSQKEKKATCPNCRKDIGDIKIDRNIKLKFERHFTKVDVLGYEMFGRSTIKRDVLMNYLCIENNQCTILNGGQKLTYQDWYYCETCDMKENHGICERCRKTCHAGHVTCLSKDSPSLFRCCCGNGECEIECKCLKVCEKTTVKKGPIINSIKLPCAKELLNDALRSGCCTFNVTGRNYISQEAYCCKDCEIVGRYVMCVICKDKCHSGHNVERRFDSKTSFCDCGCGRGRHPCKCMSRENKRKRDDNKTNEAKKRKTVK